MTRTENEQELVLGNKQLLSAFFVVVALLGVFFTMGYIIGRNTGGNVSKDVAKDASANASPPPETAARTIAPEPAAPIRETAPPETTATETPATHPAVGEAKRSEPKPAPVVDAEPAAVDTPSTPVDVQSAPGHQYLQVMAVKLPEADKMVALLRRRGLPALVGESSKPELYRVLVGPFSDTPTLAKAKTTLKDLGFESVVSK